MDILSCSYRDAIYLVIFLTQKDFRVILLNQKGKFLVDQIQTLIRKKMSREKLSQICISVHMFHEFLPYCSAHGLGTNQNLILFS